MCQAISELTCRQFNKALRLSPLFAVLATDHVLTVGDCITILHEFIDYFSGFKAIPLQSW